MLAVEPQNDPGAAHEALPNVFYFSFWLFPSLLWIVTVHGHDSKKTSSAAHYRDKEQQNSGIRQHSDC